MDQVMFARRAQAFGGNGGAASIAAMAQLEASLVEVVALPDRHTKRRGW